MKSITYIMLLFLCLATEAKSNDIVKQIQNNRPRISKVWATKLAVTIDRLARKHNVDAKLIAAMIYVESSYRMVRRGHDYGLMQVNTRFHKVNKRKMLTNKEYSIEAGVVILKELLKKHDLNEAIARYNCGYQKGCTEWRVVKEYVKRVKRSY